MRCQTNRSTSLRSRSKVKSESKLVVVILLCMVTTGCVSTVVGAVVKTTVAVVKVPFKVAGAVIDAATPDDDKNDLLESLTDDYRDGDASSDAAAVNMESEGL